jgi:hypothetical protein
MENPKKRSLVLSPEQLETKAQNEPPEIWLIDGLLPTSSRRPSLLVSKPAVVKTTVSRQVLVSVAKGEPFFGRATVRSECLLWQTEAYGRHVWDSLKALGYDRTKDAAIYTFLGEPNENTMIALAQTLEEHPGIRLVAIETMDDLLRLDLNENVDARDKFNKFAEIIMSKFSHRCAFLGLHHGKKREMENSADSILGAMTIQGRTDGKWFIKRKSDADPRRIFHTEVRRGRNIPPTYLEFDPVTGRSNLGSTVEQERIDGFKETTERIRKQVREFLWAHPNSTIDEILAATKGNFDKVRQTLKDMCSGELPLIIRSGKGKRGQPATYSLAEIPVEGKAA